MSHTSTIRLLDELGAEHDKVVHQWRKELLGSLQVKIRLHLHCMAIKVLLLLLQLWLAHISTIAFHDTFCAHVVALFFAHFTLLTLTFLYTCTISAI